MSIKLLQAVPGYQTELTDSFAADVSFPSLSLLSLPLPAFAFGGV